MSENRNSNLPQIRAMDEATGNVVRIATTQWPATQEELAAAAMHRGVVKMEAMPKSLADKLDAMVDANDISGNTPSNPTHAAGSAEPMMQFKGDDSSRPRVGSGSRSWLPWALAAAAGLALVTTVAMMQRSASTRERELAQAKATIAELETRVATNEQLLVVARADLAKRTDESAALALRELRLAEQLADATRKYATLQSELDVATVKIAKLEAPVDPAELQRSRTKLLEVPGTIRLAWSPFNIEGAAPAEQPGLTGDVVWNDEQQSGYLRFAGLKVNDPKIEQYQVWVIDERGMEQKVSGGVFNATADGEVVVPIHPGIDVGKVVLFAITVEKPGGTWVPDLKRRLVVAPRGT